MKVKTITYYFCLLTRQDFFTANYRKSDYTQFRKSERLLLHTRWSGQELVPGGSFGGSKDSPSPRSPCHPLHTASRPPCPSWSLCGYGSSGSQAASATLRTGEMGPFPCWVSFHQRGAHFLSSQGDVPLGSSHQDCVVSP